MPGQHASQIRTLSAVQLARGLLLLQALTMFGFAGHASPVRPASVEGLGDLENVWARPRGSTQHAGQGSSMLAECSTACCLAAVGVLGTGLWPTLKQTLAMAKHARATSQDALKYEICDGIHMQ